MRLKIVSDGTSNGTKIVDEESGEEVRGVTHIEWSLGVDELAKVTIEFEAVSVDVKGELDTTVWIRTEDNLPEEDEIVGVLGGIAKYKNGYWFSGTEEPYFTRIIQWEVWSWHRIQ